MISNSMMLIAVAQCGYAACKKVRGAATRTRARGPCVRHALLPLFLSLSLSLSAHCMRS